MDRRAFLGASLAGFLGSRLSPGLIGSPAQAQDTAATPFSFETVLARARDLATRPYASPEMTLTPPFANLDYDQHRAIRFRPEKRLFQDARSFQMEMLPPGSYFDDRIEINIVQNGTTRPLDFSTDYFAFHPDYFPFPDGRAPSDMARDLGFTGMRFRYPINRPGVFDEIAVFQGASYFRAVAHDTFYGLSARGIAIDTGEPTPEEFPIFTAFWVEDPAPGATTLRLCALLDGPSLTGAYDFTITPGNETVMEIRAVLFPRVEITRVGIAPLTSMYFFGSESRVGVDDFRDAVHDSDGLMILDRDGQRLWRPLKNPTEVQVSAFRQTDPRRFGLIQRARDYAHFADEEAHYQDRVSAWVEPIGDWGPGAVMLFELPTDSDLHDNIVAFWRPDAALPAGVEQSFSYRLIWGPQPAEDLPLARVVSTRSGLYILDHSERIFAVDFDLGLINIDTIKPVLTASAGEVKALSISRLPEGNVARISFRFIPGDLKSAEFRLTLASEDNLASEVWLYRWTHKNI